MCMQMGGLDVTEGWGGSSGAGTPGEGEASPSWSSRLQANKATHGKAYFRELPACEDQYIIHPSSCSIPSSLWKEQHCMEQTWVIAGLGWGVAVIGWLLPPTVSLLLNRFFPRPAYDDTSRKLRDLEIYTIPKLKLTLREVEEQRMLRAAKDKGSESDLMTLGQLTKDLKSALYEAEDILDLVDYHRVERNFSRGAEPHGSSCQPGAPAPPPQVITRALVLQCARRWYCQLGQFRGATSGALLPISDSTSISGLHRIRGWSRQLVVNITNSFRPVHMWLTDAVVANQKDGSAIDSFLLTIDKRSLRERIEQIEYIANEARKSHLLNQQNGSSKLTVKHNDKESTSKQKDIDDLHRSIEQKVFGREKELKHICGILRKGPNAHSASSSTSRCYSVLGIHGIAGSGKSTLAQYICDYEEAEGNHFHPVMFIHVSKTFRLDDVFRDMLEKITQSRPSYTKGLKSLYKELKDKLKGKCFLLVLDDVWVNCGNQKEWHILLDAVNAGQRGSRILVTAQTKDAATALGAQEHIPIPDLGKDHYLSLFLHHALQGTVGDDGEYERIGRRIVEKLHRSPIAAVTVAKRLQRNSSIDFWETTANLDVLNETMGALWWSYQQLGADIRRCFEYCSMFPRGYMLKREMLVHLWIAQGFVKTSDAAEEMEDLGKRYFDELLTFSFLQVQRTIIGTEQFKIHDLLHELAERVAGTDFLRIDANGLPNDIPTEVRHLFIETYDKAEITEKLLGLGNLHTLILEELGGSVAKMVAAPLKYNENDIIKDEAFGSMLMRLRKLRVLIVKVRGHNKLVFSIPASIDQLKHLRYIRFRFTNILKLIIPSTVSKLYHLQILDTPDLRLSCAEDVADLIHLRHCYSSLNFPNIGRLTSLQTVPHFRVGKEQGYELKQLKHLNKLRGTLRISSLGTVGSKEEALEAQLARKIWLRVLVLDFNEKIRSPDVETEIIEGLCPPVHLVQLCIWYYCGSRYPSWMLSRQHPDAPKHLDKLELCECRRLVSIPEDCEFFARLRLLRIVSCIWDALPDNMEGLRSLQKLVIRSCKNIELLPTLPRSLEEITFVDVGKLKASCKERGHRNWLNIQHIPNKKLYD
ncbi:hypothetical protein HU200_005216 [Digitaria exilis]|uniref:AAA+ ATPase domain-containing protein n=1 Tax=Digitaria exilis TaxID=1010633 RepID=A0A835KT09_9POAL|nr:hypothetical protein HU200_005216 [Digitaria exilis]